MKWCTLLSHKTVINPRNKPKPRNRQIEKLSIYLSICLSIIYIYMHVLLLCFKLLWIRMYHYYWLCKLSQLRNIKRFKVKRNKKVFHYLWKIRNVTIVLFHSLRLLYINLFEFPWLLIGKCKFVIHSVIVIW